MKRRQGNPAKTPIIIFCFIVERIFRALIIILDRNGYVILFNRRLQLSLSLKITARLIGTSSRRVDTTHGSTIFT